MKYQIVHLSFVKIQTFIYVIVHNELLPYHLSMNRHIPILKVEFPSMITGQAQLHPNRHPRFNVGISEKQKYFARKEYICIYKEPCSTDLRNISIRYQRQQLP